MAKINEIHWLNKPIETVLENAHRKCFSIACTKPDAIVIAADTVVSFQGQTVGKPRDLAEAQAFFRRFSGQKQDVFSGLSLALPGQPVRTEAIQSTVHFKLLDEDAIESYLHAVNPLDKAGGYNIDQDSDLIIDHYDGSYSNIVGLPIETLITWLQESGVINAT
jgi:septum formation protein